MRHIPASIWLQPCGCSLGGQFRKGERCENADTDFDDLDVSEITWSERQQFCCDLLYVRPESMIESILRLSTTEIYHDVDGRREFVSIEKNTLISLLRLKCFVEEFPTFHALTETEGDA